MFTPNKRSLAAIVVIAAASAPSTASARFVAEGGSPAPAPSAAPLTLTGPPLPSAFVSSHGFRWDDAAIGAAGMLVVVGVGSGAVVARRRRTDPLAN